MKLLPLFISSLSVSLRSANALWPVPRNLEKGTSHLLLSPSFDIQVEGVAFSDVPGDLQGAIGRTKTRLWEDRLGRLVPGRGQSDLQASAAPGSLSLLTLSIKPPPGEGKGAKVPSITSEVLKDVSARDESYSLHVPADGAPARISANSSLGLLRGLGTFEQLWYWAEKGGEAGTGVVYMHEAPVVVKDDRPAYPYRGFMLDTARNFFPVPDIKRTLDAMSMVKMSQFHWHVVDSQSFPLEVPEFPELAQKGAYSEKEKYSTQDVQDIVKYAAERGIDVLMEIDIPGHTAILAESHPEHIACLHASPWSQYANEPPAGQLRLASAATADFTVALISAIASRLPGTLFSTGGDEINQNCYREDAQTQKDLKESGKTLEQALDGFTGRVHEAVRGRGKRVVVWEEMALEHQVGLANDTVVMVWISSKNAAKVAKKGFHVVHAPSDYFYLDCGAGEWIGNSAGTNSWCDPFKSWQKAYTFDPLASLTKDQASLVLGGQQLLWAEQSSPENLDSIVWPRAAVSAEIFWTGPRLPSGASRSVGEALPRLHDIRFRMVQRGVKAIALQPLWCALRPGQCDSGGVTSMVWNLAVRWFFGKAFEWYRRVALVLETKYREHVGFNEF